MKKLIVAVPIVLMVLMGAVNTVNAAGEWQELPKNVDGTLKNIPENTECREIDFYNDERRTDNSNETYYDLCIGSFPKFASTSVEEGIAPFYYLKYYFFPEPMPIYDVTNTDTTIGGSVIKGLKQEVTMQREDLEAYDYPLDDSNKDLFLHYPYDRSHADAFPINTTIKGPYQVGYNSFYHNTYRSRYFAEQVKFEFLVLEPRRGYEVVNPSERYDVYPDKDVLFTGEIIYDLYEESDPNKCFRVDYLDYTDECRSIEFYFPTSNAHPSPPYPYNDDEIYRPGEVYNENGIDQYGKDTIWSNRYPYKNPGEHRLVVNVIENTQLRYQKDLGGEFQRTTSEPGPNNTEQGAGSFASAQNGEVYFLRQDIDTSSQITPRTERQGEPTFPQANATTIGLPILNMENGHWVYDRTKNEAYENYCDVDTGTFGDNNYEYRSTGPTTSLADQVNTTCYHNHNAEFHYWKYYWSNTGWYADDPEIY